MLEKIEEKMYQEIQLLFAETEISKLTDDVQEYQKNIKKITEISHILNIPVQTITTDVVLIERK